jgi:hypothetical protein
MTLLLTVVGVVAAICLTVACLVGQQILAIEVSAWMEVLSRHLVERAVRKIPELHRLRYQEEWLAELAAFRSRPISALGYSLGVLAQAERTGSELDAGASELSKLSPGAADRTPGIAVGDVWDALDAAGIHPEGVGLGSAYFRVDDGHLLKFPNRGFFDHGMASTELLAIFAAWGVRPTASGRYPMPVDANEWVRQPREPMLVDHHRA